MHVTQLASGTINGADQLSIELREPIDAPATVWIIWPTQPTITDPEAAQYHRQPSNGDLGSGVYAARGDPGETAVSCKIRPLVLTSAPGVLRCRGRY